MPNYRIFVAPREREFEGVNLTNITNGSQSSRGTLGIMIPTDKDVTGERINGDA